jgi:hypothetical protein
MLASACFPSDGLSPLVQFALVFEVFDPVSPVSPFLLTLFLAFLGDRV